MKSFGFATLFVLCFVHLFPLLLYPAEKGVSAPLRAESSQEEPVVPPDAQEKAIQALKALGPDRGAKKISYGVASILGASKEIKFDSKQVQKTLKDLGAKETKTEIQIDLPGDILFDFDKWDIRSDAEETLKRVGGIIKTYHSPKVVISGHTDSKGAKDYNQQLSLKRAESVKTWLVKNAGIDTKIVTTEGLGDTKPVASNTKPDGSDNPEGRQKNRRVEIVIRKL